MFYFLNWLVAGLGSAMQLENVNQSRHQLLRIFSWQCSCYQESQTYVCLSVQLRTCVKKCLRSSGKKEKNEKRKHIFQGDFSDVVKTLTKTTSEINSKTGAQS